MSSSSIRSIRSKGSSGSVDMLLPAEKEGFRAEKVEREGEKEKEGKEKDEKERRRRRRREIESGKENARSAESQLHSFVRDSLADSDSTTKVGMKTLMYPYTPPYTPSHTLIHPLIHPYDATTQKVSNNIGERESRKNSTQQGTHNQKILSISERIKLRHS